MLRNRTKHLAVGLFSILFSVTIYLLFIFVIKDGIRLDYQTNDFFYESLSGSLIKYPKSSQIVYLTITDDTYKNLFKKNTFNRKLLAEGLIKLSEYNPQSVIIDIIFAYPGDSASDELLASAISKNNTFLPVSFSLISENRSSSKKTTTDKSEEIFKAKLTRPAVKNGFTKLQSGRSILQLDKFIIRASGIGHISDFSDVDGIVRHTLLTIPVDSFYLPSLYLSAYLDYTRVPFDSIRIDFTKGITLPALKESWLNDDIIIPVDESGRTLIPYADNWLEDFPMISLVRFLELAKDKGNTGTLIKFFEGKFVIVGDVSTGIADLASTTVDKNAPLITIQSSMLNALLQNKFINKWPMKKNIVIVLVAIILLTVSSFLNRQKIFYNTFIVLFVLLLLFYVIALVNLQFISLISILMGYLVYAVGLLIIMEITTSKAKKVIEADNIRRTLEMDEARKIQLSMLPQKMPKIKDLNIAAYLSTASEVGGDYYDFFVDSENRLRIIIGDATGHGLKAGTMVTIIKTLFSTFREFDDLKNMLNKMSSIIKEFQLNQLFICLSVFVYESQKFKFTSAGMPPVIIFKKKMNLTDSITLKGMPLGVWNNFPYETAEFSLEDGDAVLLSSDGLMELFNKNDEMLGMEKIEEIFRQNAEKDPEEILDNFKEVIKKWTEGTEAKDDITILIIKYQKE